jgi:hypothetical protein
MNLQEENARIDVLEQRYNRLFWVVLFLLLVYIATSLIYDFGG